MKKINQILVLVLIFLSKTSSAEMTDKYEKAILAGGCFWGVEELFSKLDGVIATKVGYTGGNIANPNYEIISTGISNHAESVEVAFNPQKITYENILKFFFTIHDPTTLNRQQNDVGSQYRSEIFYVDEKQRNSALKVIQKANQSGVFDGLVITKLSKAKIFYVAEAYHQSYLKKNPYGYTCHHPRAEWKF